MSDTIKPVPGMDTKGWITTTETMCDRLLSHFLLAEYSQTALYKGSVASMPWLVQEYKDSILSMVEYTKSTLLNYFGAYFPKAEVNVYYKDEPNGSVSLYINVEVTDDEGKTYPVGKALEIEGSKIKRIAKMNNDGTYTPEMIL